MHKSESSLEAFVLMPFQEEFNSIYENLIKKPLQEVGFNVIRADSFIETRNILKDIIISIRDADIIVADLTTLNPNVFYELGIAQAMDKPTIMLIQSNENIPFDLMSYRLIQYSTHFEDSKKLISELKGIGEQFKLNQLQFSNPVRDYINFPKVHEINHSSPIIRVDEEMDNEIIEEGRLDILVDSIDSMQEIKSSVNKITEGMKTLTKNFESTQSDLIETQKDITPGSAVRQQRILQKLANDMIEFSELVEDELQKLSKYWDIFMIKSESLFSLIIFKSDADRTGASTVFSTLKIFFDSIGEAVKQTQYARNSAQGLKGVSKDLNRATKRLTKALDGYITQQNTGASYTKRLINILEQKLTIENSTSLNVE